jgi:hypothetical protein
MSLKRLSSKLKLLLSAPDENGDDPTTIKRRSRRGSSNNTPTTPTRNLIRIMLLGAGDSGKSTFFKQVRHIYEREDIDSASPIKESFRGAIYFNIMETMQALVKSYFEHNQNFPDTPLPMSTENMVHFK